MFMENAGSQVNVVAAYSALMLLLYSIDIRGFGNRYTFIFQSFLLKQHSFGLYSTLVLSVFAWYVLLIQSPII